MFVSADNGVCTLHCHAPIDVKHDRKTLTTQVLQLVHEAFTSLGAYPAE